MDKRIRAIEEKTEIWRKISRLMTDCRDHASFSNKLLCTFVWLPTSIVWWILGFMVLNLSSCLIALLLQKLGIADVDSLVDELCDILKFTLNVDRKIDIFFYRFIRKDLMDELRDPIDEMIEKFGTF